MRFVFYALVMVFLLGNLAFASEISVLSYPSNIIFSDGDTYKEISVSFSCPSFENKSLTYAAVKFYNYQEMKATYNGVYYSALINVFNLPTIYGSKPLSLYCYYNDSTVLRKDLSIVVDKLSLDVVYPTFSDPLKVYKGDYFLNVKFRITSSYVPIDVNSLSNIYIVLKNADASYEIRDLIVSYEGNDVYLVGYVPYEFEEGVYDLIIYATYTFNGTTTELKGESLRSFEITSPISFEFVEPAKGSVLKLEKTKSFVFKFKVYDKGEVVYDLIQDNLEIYAGDKKAIINDFYYDEESGLYVMNVEFVFPTTIVDNEVPVIWVVKDYKNYPDLSFEPFDLQYVYVLQGKLVGDNNNIYKARFVFENQESIYEFSTNNLGEYSILIPKGVYNLTVVINNRDEFKYYEVDISSSYSNFFNVEYLIDYSLQDLRVVSLVYAELSAPYEYAYYKVYYSDKNIYDERNLRVFVCEYWSPSQLKCNDEWRLVEFDKNILANYVSLELEQGAVAIVEDKYVYIDASLEKTDYYSRESVQVSGYVKSINGEGVANIPVKYEVKNKGVRGEVISGANGRFTFSFNAPLPVGKSETMELVLYVDKKGVVSQNLTLTFNVEKRVKLTAYVDDVVIVSPGETKDLEILLKNEGDMDLSDIELMVSGIKDDWYAITPAFIETLKAQDQTNILMRLMIPKDYCSQTTECKEYYFVNIKIKSKELTDTISFTLRITNQTKTTSTQQSTTSNEYAPNKESFVESLTGKFVSVSWQTSNINYYLIIGFFVVAFILITIKKRSRFTRSSTRRAMLLRKRF